jgi:hypothetical protein
MRAVASLALPLAVAAVLALAGPAGAAKSVFTQFRSPSGNIGCFYAKGGGGPEMIRCDVRDLARIPARPRSCKLDWGHAFALGRHGKATRVCAGDTALDPGARVLAYGKTRRLGAFRCISRASGMRCVARSGHGFSLSREAQKLF